MLTRGKGHDPATADQADATITLPDGIRHNATFMTFEAITKDGRMSQRPVVLMLEPGHDLQAWLRRKVKT